MTATDSRSEVLRRIRAALGDRPGADPRPAPDPAAIPRAYLAVHADRTPEQRTDLLAENLADYRAHVHHCTADGLAGTLARLLAERGSRTAVVPPGLSRDWLTSITGTDILGDEPALTAHQLDAVDSVITACALAIAETGTLVLDASPDQGRRILSLVPDHHICIVHAPEQVVTSLPRAMPRLDPRKPMTWISGPSATSDIELDRVEGVHGPRTLDVVLVGGGAG
ncbi:LutC/YkgG family protein [Actinacidiphila bryophytorum]|uniref:LutC/YkgG family protein n=1 Tax=Actinacidiphila bryophytorum TaxID=1436133 RepID=UPI002176DC6F|nr:LUD domain-containing protein [Actinacidiphila bryophytorum]UWE09937.1 LUD domain-containing protein [Actinacidiphila bryophytorum]